MLRIRIALVALGLMAAACGGGGQPTNEQAGDGSPSQNGGGLELTADCVDATGEETVEVELTHELTIVPDCLIVSTDQPFHVRNTDFQRIHTLTISEEEYFRTPFLLDTGNIGSEEETSAGPLGDVPPGIYPMFCKFHVTQKGVIQIEA